MEDLGVQTYLRLLSLYCVFVVETKMEGTLLFTKLYRSVWLQSGFSLVTIGTNPCKKISFGGLLSHLTNLCRLSNLTTLSVSVTSIGLHRGSLTPTNGCGQLLVRYKLMTSKLTNRIHATTAARTPFVISGGARPSVIHLLGYYSIS